MYRLVQAVTRPTESVLHRRPLQSVLASRGFHASRFQLEEKKPSKEQDPVSFRLSLYQSTFDRIQRERADSEHFAQLRNETDRSWFGTTAALIIRMVLLPQSLSSSY